MENDFLTFSNFELLFFSGLALLMFVVLFISKRFIPYLTKSESKKNLIKQYIAIFEVGIWSIFIIICIQQFSDSNKLYSWGLFLLLMLSAFWILWFSIKDFIAGALFKMNQDFKEKDIIQVNNFEGKIIEMSNRLFKIESDSGEIIYIPYSKLSNQTIIKVHPGEMVLSHAFTIKSNKSDKAETKIDKIRFEILSLPWASIKRPPKVEIIHEDESGYIFEIKLYSLEKQYFFKMEQEIRKKFDV
ncbi:MAG: mechanosensitive ion channel [Bacteroidales bacterium]|jgi:small-conductance mechanosensitive channel|nr:mechanosensitive ion channel [Bacteroidales bacterium]